MSQARAPQPSTHQPPALDDDAARARQARILDAAERCFVRAGFHRTTMQDVAAEAGMSPGNLYRYFASKGAIVAGLTERDRADLGRSFAELEGRTDLVASFARLAHEHFGAASRDESVLCLEIWAEACRNADFAARNAEFDRDVTARLAGLFRDAQGRGTVAPEVDPEALGSLACTHAYGLIVRRAILPDYDPDAEIARFIAVIEAGMAGRIPLPPAASRT